MLNNNEQLELSFDMYAHLYDKLVPSDNRYRIINNNVNFDFVRVELKDKYCLDNGRNAIDPIVLFKYLMIKDLEHLSDEDVVKHSMYDLSLKYFLGFSVDKTDLINPSTLTKFRKLRLQDNNLMSILLKQTTKLGIRKGVISKHTAIIVDSTHTKARYNAISPREMLIERSKLLRKEVYYRNRDIKSKLPSKKENTGILEDEIKYCKELIEVITKEESVIIYDHVKERINYLNEGLADIEEKLAISYDEEARVGHKTADTNFFGYKTHLAVNEDGIILAAVVSSGEKTDGKYLPELVEKAQEAGVEVNEVIGDKAYSYIDNIEYAKENNIKLVSRLGLLGLRKDNSGFEFNKDAGMYQCPMGHLATKKNKSGTIKERVLLYYFDIEKCKHCTKKEGCYKEGAKTKTYSIKIDSDERTAQKEFEKTEEFEKEIKKRYVVEQTNAILKNNHRYDVAFSAGIGGLEIQGAIALFNTNLKKVLYPNPKRTRNKAEK